MTETRRDFVPKNATQLRVFMQNLIAYITVKTTSSWDGWTHIPRERIVALTARFDDFVSALQAFEHTGNCERRDEAQTKCVAELRVFVNEFLRCPPVTNADRIEMRINNHDTTRADHGEVSEEIENYVEADGGRTLAVHFKITGADNNAKPHGYDGAVTIWQIGDEKPDTPEEYSHHQMASRSPFRIHFEEEDRSKKVWIMQCWQNGCGVTGKWSEAIFSFVP